MKGLLTIVLFHGITISATQDLPCSWFPLPIDLYFDETSTAGSVIFISNETNSTIQEWKVTDPNPRVALMLVNQTYQLTLLAPVDLDVANAEGPCVSGQQQFKQRITCDLVGPTDKEVTFYVRPVNEYVPEFTGEIDIQISENATKPMPLFLHRLLDRFIDRDCPKEHITLNILNKSSETDASEYFMVNSSSGFLFQIKKFDYEDTAIQCNLGKEGFLTITAEDGVHKISKDLKVTFLDVDDSPPVFVNAACVSTCYNCPISYLKSTVTYTYQGVIITDPTRIKALDPDSDSNSTNITYYMEVYPEKYKANIVYENETFILPQSFSNFSGYGEDSDFTVTVLLQASGSNGQTSDNFTLTIDVTVPPTTTPAPTTTTTITTTTEVTIQTTNPTTTPPTTTIPTTTTAVRDSNSDKTDDDKVLVIVLPILAALALIIVIVIIYKVRNKQPQHKYDLQEKEGVNGMAVNGEMMEKKSMEVDNPVFAGEKVSV